MKKAKLALVISLMVLAYMTGRLHQQEDSVKHYQVACILNDVCHYMMDNLDDADEIYEETISNLDTDPKLFITREDVDGYYWSY